MRPALGAVRPVLSALALVAALGAPAGAAGFPWNRYAKKPEAWYRSDEAARAAANVLSHQSARGDWPKNEDTSARPFDGDRARLKGTFDNGATVGEVRFLARAYAAAGRAPYREAVLRAVDHVLSAQYPNGGFPQSFPKPKGYARYITFNDNTMVNLLSLLRDVAASGEFSFVDAPRREAAGRAFRAGVGCILKCQITVNGRPTVWCAQHDEVTLEPRGARAFELASLSGSESAGVLLLLMSLDDPGPDVVRAVDAGAAWFAASKITGVRETKVNGDKVIVPDPGAPPLWARFYEIDTNRPFFCGRDGVKKYALSEIEPERRNGYAWYGEWGRPVAARYAAWTASRDRGGPAATRVRASGPGGRSEDR